MSRVARKSTTAWAEDTALLRSNRSADPGAKTARGRHDAAFLRVRDWHESDKPSRHDAAKSLAGRPSKFINASRPKVHFPLNQHSPTSCLLTLTTYNLSPSAVDQLICESYLSMD